MFSAKYRYGVILIIALYSYWNTLFAEVYYYYPIHASGYAVVGIFFLLTALVWEGDRILEKIVHAARNGADPIRTLVIFFLSSVVFSSIVSLTLVYATARWIYGMDGVEMGITLKLGFTLGTRINLFLQVINGIFFFVGRYRDKLLEAEEYKRASAQAQLQAIKNQVNPHFLFNNLNALASMVIRDNPEANKFIEEFSTVYRYVLDSGQKELARVSEELAFIRHYIFLLNKRFPDSIYFLISVDPEFEEYYLIPVALQMLIENAIKHNIASKANPLNITLFVTFENGPSRPALAVRNNLQPRPANEEGTQIGLKNIGQRYELISGENISFRQADNHFLVILPLIKPRP